MSLEATTATASVNNALVLCFLRCSRSPECVTLISHHDVLLINQHTPSMMSTDELVSLPVRPLLTTKMMMTQVIAAMGDVRVSRCVDARVLVYQE